MKRRNLAVWTCALMVSLLLGGCGGSSGGMSAAPSAVITSSSNQFTDMNWDSPMEEPEFDDGYLYEELNAVEAAEDNAGNSGKRPEKIVYTAHLNMETTEFEEAIQNLNALTSSCGGYYESNSLNHYSSRYRYADYTIRIPTGNYETFLTQAGEICHILHQEQNQENISAAYYDSAGRLESQKIKLTRLQELLTQAETMEDIITIESAISDTELRIDELSGELRNYDRKVDYSTIHVNLREVYKLSNVEEAPIGFGGRLLAAFTAGGRNFISDWEDIVIALLSMWLWLLVWGVAVFALIRFVVIPRRKKRNATKIPNQTPENQANHEHHDD